MSIRLYLLVILIYISLISVVEHLFMCLFAIYTCFLEKCLLKSFACFLIRLFVVVELYTWLHFKWLCKYYIISLTCKAENIYYLPF